MLHTVCKKILPSSLLATIAMISVSPAYALQSDFQEQISVSSNKQIAEMSKNEITFSENVIIKQGTLLIKADKVSIKQLPNGQLKQILATGAPATYEQKMENGRLIHAQGLELAYYPVNQTITLKKKAFIQQEDSKLSGDSISYNIKDERIEAETTNKSNDNRVTTVFIPEQLKTQINDSKQNKSTK